MRKIDYKIPVVFCIIVCLLVSVVGRAQRSPIEPVRVGVFLALSGGSTLYGRALLNGIELAAAEINAKRSIERRIELVIEDTRSNAAEAATAVTRLINQKRVHALIGDIGSSNTLAAVPIAQFAKVPLITSATHPILTQDRDYIFRVTFPDPFQGHALAQFAEGRLKAKRVAWLVEVSSDYSKSIATAFEQKLISLGGHIVMKQSYRQGDRDFKAQLSSIKSSKADVVFVGGYYSDAGLIARQAKEIGLDKPLLGGDGWDSRQLWELGGTALNGSYISNHYAFDNPAKVNKEFGAKYKAQYGVEPNALAALGYDAMKLLADSVERAGTTDGPALRNALAETRDLEGVTGTITLDENRNALKAFILKLQDGKFVYSETILPAKGIPK